MPLSTQPGAQHSHRDSVRAGKLHAVLVTLGRLYPSLTPGAQVLATVPATVPSQALGGFFNRAKAHSAVVQHHASQDAVSRMGIC
jgi:hypothetical protein